MKKIGIVTTTRAEYGLLMPVIKELRKYESDDFIVELIVSGTHFYEEYGNTIEEIEESELRIDERIKVPVNSRNVMDISHNQAVTLGVFTELFYDKKYSGIVILGDRYEMLAIAIAAGNTHTPIFHLCGGDTTEGAIDEWIRHSITKISYIHFPTNLESYNRILQLGESPQRVFNYGSTSIDNIMYNANMNKKEALNSLGLCDCRYAICTYHPVTMEAGNVDKEMGEFIDAIKCYPEIQFIVTKSNADQSGEHINMLLDKAAESIDNMHVYSSLGVVRYLSLMRYAEFVLGNSSSGIIEAPAFKVPTINIGDRQKGRLQSQSIINCKPDLDSIKKSIDIALSDEFRKLCLTVISPYGDGNAAIKIANKIVDTVREGNINLKKTFYNIEVLRK